MVLDVGAVNKFPYFQLWIIYFPPKALGESNR